MKYFILFAITLMLCACSHHNPSESAYSNWDNNHGKRSFTIHTRDDKVVLGINDSTVFMKLSKEELNHVNRDLVTDSNNTDDWAAEFSNFVKSHVRKLVNRKLEYRISDINSVAYEDNGLVFDFRRKHFFSFDRVIDQGKPVLKNFSEKDAKAFIAHFNAIKDRKN